MNAVDAASRPSCDQSSRARLRHVDWEGGGDAGGIGVDLVIEASGDGDLEVLWHDDEGGEAIGQVKHREDDEQTIAELARAFFARREELTQAEAERLAPDDLRQARRIERLLGQRLGNLLLPAGPVRTRFKGLAEGGQHLIVRLGVGGEERVASTVRALPWELARVFEVAIFGRGDVDLVRLTALGPRVRSDLPSPGAIPRVLVAQGSRRTCEGLHDAPGLEVPLKAHRVLPTVLGDEAELVVRSGTAQDLRLYLRSGGGQTFDLFIFEGHGASDRLWMDDPVAKCGATWVRALEMAEILRGHARAALLIACNAGQAAEGPGALPGVAEALAEAGIPAVGFQTAIWNVEAPSRDETQAALRAVGELVRSGGTLRATTARIRASLTKARSGDEVAFARPVLWQSTPEDVWIREPASDGWDLIRRSPCAERPWGDGGWLARPAADWDAVLSTDGRAWARRARNGMTFTTVDETRAWTVKRIDSDAIPVAISPIDQDHRVCLLTNAERCKSWRVLLDADPQTPITVSEVGGDARCAAWIGDRFAWVDTEGTVHCRGDLPAADATHISSAADGDLTITAWIDMQGMLWGHRRQAEATEVRRLPLPDQTAAIDELAVTLTPDGAGRMWVRTDTTWRGCNWTSMVPASP
jgi:hypothetical protein